MKHFRMTAGSFVVGLLQKYSKDWKERYLDIQARHSRALCRTQASVKCVSHKCLLRWGQCVCIGVYSKCMCLSVCGDVVYGSGWFILSTVGPVISWGWASLSPRPAQPSPRARLSSGVLMKCRPAQAPRTFLSEPITPNTSLRFVWEWVVGNAAIIHSLYFILIF